MWILTLQPTNKQTKFVFSLRLVQDVTGMRDAQASYINLSK